MVEPKAKPKRKAGGKKKPRPQAYVLQSGNDNAPGYGPRKGKFQIDGVVTLVPYKVNQNYVTLPGKAPEGDIGMYPAYARPNEGNIPSNKPRSNKAQIRYLEALKAKGLLNETGLKEWAKLTRPDEVANGGLDPSAQVASKVGDEIAKVATDAVAEII